MLSAPCPKDNYLWEDVALGRALFARTTIIEPYVWINIGQALIGMAVY